MLAPMEHMVVLDTALGTLMVPDTGVCRWAKLSHLQHTAHEAGSLVGNISNLRIANSQEIGKI